MFKKKLEKYFGFVLSIIALYLCAGLPLYASDKYIASGYYNNYPYEYLNNEGKPSGFIVELFTVIAEKARINTELLLLPPERMADILENGESDIIIGGVDSDAYAEFSFAGTALEISFSFAARRDSLISDFRDLKERRIVVTGHEIFSEHLSDIIRKFYHSQTSYINNPETSMMLLASKGCDVVCIQRVKLKEIQQNLLQDSIYELELNPGKFRYGYFVRKGNDILLKDIRAGLSGVYSSGDYGAIYSRWFQDKNKNMSLDKNFLLAWFVVSAAVFILFILINTRVLRKRINEKTAVLADTIDILKKTEAELLNKEKKYRKIFNKSPSGILILNSSGRIVHYNESIKRIFGIIDPDEILNLDVIESPNSTEWFKARIKNYHSVSIEFKYDFELIKSTGFYKTSKEGEIIIDATIFPFSIHSGEADPGYICHILDVTQSRTLLQNRNETARRYEVIFDSVRDGLWEWRLEDDSLRINRQFVNMLGYRTEYLPQTFTGLCSLIHPEDREETAGIIRDKITGGRSFTVEYRILKNDGSWLRIRSRGDVVEWDHDLSPVAVIATHTDISRVTLIEKSETDELTMEKDMINKNNEYSPVDSFDGRKALIVDDNCLITLHLADLLTRMGFLCVNAMSGFEAIEIIKRDNEFDIVLLDLEMPELDGVTTLKLLKDIKSDIPVIANTGHCDFNCADILLCSGFDDVVSKPVQDMVLLEKIEKLLAAAKQIQRN